MSDSEVPKRHDPTARERHRRYREKLRAAFAAQNAPRVVNVDDVEDVDAVVNAPLGIDQIVAWWEAAGDYDRECLMAGLEAAIYYLPNRVTNEFLEDYMADMFDEVAAQRGYVKAAPAPSPAPRRWWQR